MLIAAGIRRWRVAACAIALLAASACGRGLDSGANQQISATSAGATAPQHFTARPKQVEGFPYDWSHRHLIFSRPRSAAMARRMEQEPRYRIQQAWRARQANTASADAYMHALDALAVELAKSSTVPVLPHIKWGQPAPHPRKIPLGAWGESLNVTVSSNGGLSASYPAKFTFTSSTSCTDWVVFTVPVVGSSTQFNLFAFKNLYTATCGGPTLKFAYAVSTVGGPLLTAPVISLLGDQVAFVENGPTAALDVVKFTDVTSPPTFPAPSPASVLPSCGTAPCRNNLTYTFSASATLSAPFYDYAPGQDTAYVSDDNSTVWAISPVFSGTPAKKSSWPGGGIMVSNLNPGKLAEPVYDSTSGNVFVGDNQGNLYYIRTRTSSAGTCNGSTSGTPCLGDTLNTAACTGSGTPQSCCTGVKKGCQFLKVSTTSHQIVEPVIVDSSTGKVFVFSNGNPNTGSGSSVVQTDVTLSVINVASVGAGSSNVIHAGTFDNNYINNPTTGLLYVCGQDSSSHPQLYAFGFTNTPTAGTMNTAPVAAPFPLATANAACSPLTENYDGTTDRLFLGVTTGCPASGASGSGCVESYNITSGFPSFTTPPYAINFSQLSSLGTSTGTTGIVIDNTSGTSNQFNIYFETQGAGSSCATYSGGTTSTSSCAVSLTQSALN